MKGIHIFAIVALVGLIAVVYFMSRSESNTEQTNQKTSITGLASLDLGGIAGQLIKLKSGGLAPTA